MSCSPKPVNVALLGTGVRSSKGLEMRLSRITWAGPTPRAPASLRETGRGGTQRGDGPCDPAEAGVMCPQAQGRRGPPEAGTVRKDHALEPPVGAQPVDTLVLDLRLPERGEWMSVVQAAQGEVICSEKWTRPPRWQDGLAVPAKVGRWVSWPSSGHGPRTLVPARPGSVTVLGTEPAEWPASAAPRDAARRARRADVPTSAQHGGRVRWRGRAALRCVREPRRSCTGPRVNHPLRGPGLSRPREDAAWSRGRVLPAGVAHRGPRLRRSTWASSGTKWGPHGFEGCPSHHMLPASWGPLGPCLSPTPRGASPALWDPRVP